MQFDKSETFRYGSPKGAQKRDPMINSPYFCIWILYLSVGYARACFNYPDFIYRVKLLSSKVLLQGYRRAKLISTHKKFCRRHHDLVDPYNVAVSKIIST